MHSTSFERSDSYLFGARKSRCGMTINKLYVGSKYPYFISYRGKWVYLFCRRCSSDHWWHISMKQRLSLFKKYLFSRNDIHENIFCRSNLNFNSWLYLNVQCYHENGLEQGIFKNYHFEAFICMSFGSLWNRDTFQKWDLFHISSLDFMKNISNFFET